MAIVMSGANVKPTEEEAIKAHEAQFRVIMASQLARQHALRLLVENFVGLLSEVIPNSLDLIKTVGTAQRLVEEHEKAQASETHSDWTMVCLLNGLTAEELEASDEAVSRLEEITREIVATFPRPEKPEDLPRVHEWLKQFIQAYELEKGSQAASADQLLGDLLNWLESNSEES